jgi:hypothetical protein
MSQAVENPYAGDKWHALLHNSAVRSFVLAVGMVGLSGCDPVRTISHNVTIAVVDAQQMPVHGVSVNMKESWESWRSSGDATTGDDQAYRRQLWESDFVPWRKGVTDVQGHAVIALTITALDRTRGNPPPPIATLYQTANISSESRERTQMTKCIL